MNELRPLDISKRLRADGKWEPPTEFGPNGWRFDETDKGNGYGVERRVLVSVDTGLDQADPRTAWVHASISYRDENIMPDYDDLQLMHRAVWPDGHAYQCFVPPGNHINIRSNALHLWGRLDGAAVLPDFGRYGTI